MVVQLTLKQVLEKTIQREIDSQHLYADLSGIEYVSKLLKTPLKSWLSRNGSTRPFWRNI